MEQLDKYIISHSKPESDVLKWLVRETNLRTNHGRMLSGPILGNFLSMVSMMLRPNAIVELGAFTGYSTICLAEGLNEGGIIDSIELNDELEDLIRESYRRASIEERVRLHIGDAKDILSRLDRSYDLAYMDANKREYPLYYEILIDKIRPGGVIIADNVLWDGKVFRENVYKDAQTEAILRFNEMVVQDNRVSNVILPVRDGINLIRVK